MTDQHHGRTEPGFVEVADVFNTHLGDEPAGGAALCVYVDGTPVVDVWGGLADRPAGRRWAEDSMAVVFSSTKGLTAAVLTMLVDRAVLDLDVPVATYWPEFGVEGKGDIPLRWLCAHKAGLCAADEPFTIDDVVAGRPAQVLGAQKPLWEPGRDHGYHAWTAGWLLSEVIRRVTGLTVGQFFAREVAEPLGLDTYIGLPAEQHHRVVSLVPLALDAVLDPNFTEMTEALVDPTSLTFRSMTALVFESLAEMDRSDHLVAEIPSAGGVTDARSLARVYAALIGEVDGVRLVSDGAVAAAGQVEASGRDLVTLVESRFGPTHFALRGGPNWPDTLGGPRVFGHAGAGGSIGFADPDRGLAFGYVMNEMLPSTDAALRLQPLVDAAYRCLGQ